MTTLRELAPAQIEFAVQERRKNPPMPWRALAKEFHVSERLLRRRILPLLSDITPQARPSRVFTSEEVSEIVSAYTTEEGVTVRALAIRYGTCHQRIGRILKSAGIQVRKSGQSLGPKGKIVYHQSAIDRPKFSEESIETDPRYAEINAVVRRARLEAGMIDGRRRKSSMPLWFGRSSLADC